MQRYHCSTLMLGFVQVSRQTSNESIMETVMEKYSRAFAVDVKCVLNIIIRCSAINAEPQAEVDVRPRDLYKLILYILQSCRLRIIMYLD